MTTRFDLVTIDSPHTDRLAVFWSAALHLYESEREDGDRWIVLSSVDGVGPSRAKEIREGVRRLQESVHSDQYLNT